MRPIIATKVYGEVYGFPTLEPALENAVDISKLDLSVAKLMAVREDMKKIWRQSMMKNQIAIYRGLVTLGVLLA